MKMILVPTDGSAAAEKALDVALDLARQHGAAVKLLHVLLRDKEPSELLRLPEVASAEPEVTRELGELAEAPEPPHSAEEIMGHPEAPGRPVPEALLRRIGAHVLGRAEEHAAGRGVAAETLELVDGGTAASIVASAKAAGADAIVMGTRGLRQIEAMTFGSVSQEVCRTAGCTCVAVH